MFGLRVASAPYRNAVGGTGRGRRGLTLVASAAMVVSMLAAAPAWAQKPDIIPGAPEVSDAAGRPWAQNVPGADRERAYRLFLAGNELMDEALVGKAADQYREAIELWNHPAFRFNLGVALLNLMQPLDAYHNFQAAIRHGAAPIKQDKFDQALAYLERLRSQLGEIEIICDEPGASVTLDGRPLFVGPGRITRMVMPGKHQLGATNANRLPTTRDIALDPGDRASYTLTLDQLITTRRWAIWVPAVIAGAGAAVLGGGMYLDWQSSTMFDRYDQAITTACTSGCAHDQVADELRVEHRNAQLTQWGGRVTYAIGGVAAITGMVMLYLNSERVVRQSYERQSAITLLPLVGDHGAGIGAHMRF